MSFCNALSQHEVKPRLIDFAQSSRFKEYLDKAGDHTQEKQPE